MVSSFAASVRRNHFGATRKPKILHRTIKSVVSGVSTSFQTHIWGEPTLDASGQSSLSLQQQLRCYKSVDPPPTKYHKVIPAKLMVHIYKETILTPEHSHRAADCRSLFLYHSIMRVLRNPQRGGISEHALCGRGSPNSTGKGASYGAAAGAYTCQTKCLQNPGRKKMGSRTPQ